MSNPLSEHRARSLAALSELGLNLPATVTKAITGYEHAMAVRAPATPLPGQAVKLAVADHALDLVRAAFSAGRAPAALDPRKIAAAREREQADLDTAAVVAEISVVAALRLNETCGQYQAAILGALRDKHRELVTALIQHAAKLPPDADDQVAMREGGQVRESYLTARDLAAGIERLRDAAAQVDNTPARGEAPSLLEMGLAYVKTTAVSDQMTRDGATPWGGLGSFEFYVGAAQAITDPGDWWLPTVGQVRARAAEISEERRVEKLRAGASR